MNRKATPQDWPLVAALWQQVFEDDTSFIERNAAKFVGHENIFVTQRAGQLVAMLCALPCKLRGKQGRYFYALATAPAARKTGVMSSLMAYAEQQAAAQGAVFCALIPANTPLFGYYENRGYKKTSMMREIKCEIPEKLIVQAEFDTITASKLCKLRRHFVGQEVLLFDDERTAEVLADLYASGISTVETSAGYALFFVQNKTLLVAEMFAHADKDALYLLQAMQQKTGCEKAVLTLAQGKGPMRGQGVLKPFALLKVLVPGFTVGEWYIRFAMEEIG